LKLEGKAAHTTITVFLTYVKPSVDNCPQLCLGQLSGIPA